LLTLLFGGLVIVTWGAAGAFATGAATIATMATAATRKSAVAGARTRLVLAAIQAGST
jgi:hypothetical protein